MNHRLHVIQWLTVAHQKGYPEGKEGTLLKNLEPERRDAPPMTKPLYIAVALG